MLFGVAVLSHSAASWLHLIISKENNELYGCECKFIFTVSWLQQLSHQRWILEHGEIYTNDE